MTDDEKIQAVTATLVGEFYIGQRVRINPYEWPNHSKRTGTVTAIRDELISVCLDDVAESLEFFRRNVIPL